VFSADAVTPDQDIVKADAFGGPYSITKWDFNKTVEFTPNKNYKGLLAAPATRAPSSATSPSRRT
jgi:peptide/nickel transport system substrate-binding protein